MIYGKKIIDWKDLQKRTHQIFFEMDYKAEIEKKIKTVRGNAEIDVYALDNSTIPNIIYLCECKYWSKKVNQSVVHAFRSIMTDYGAHCGYIISKHGFQSGAYETSKNTNIDLLNWEDFQNLYEKRWLSKMIPKLSFHAMELDNCFNHIADGLKIKLARMSKTDLKQYKFLHSKYKHLTIFSLTKSVENFFKDEKPIKIPIYNPILDTYEEVISIDSLPNLAKGDFLKILINECITAKEEFKKLFKMDQLSIDNFLRISNS